MGERDEQDALLAFECGAGDLEQAEQRPACHERQQDAAVVVDLLSRAQALQRRLVDPREEVRLS